MVFTSAQDFFVSNGQSKKFELIQKSHVPRALPAKRSEKGCGDKNRLEAEIKLWNGSKKRIPDQITQRIHSCNMIRIFSFFFANQ